MPSIESLRCFVAAARVRNFRAAAKVVALSPAALGQRIRQLEDELNSSLFARTTRSTVLTEAGLNLLPYADRALSAVDDCMRAGRGELEVAPMELTLGTRHELGLSWIVPMIPALRDEHPGLTLHLYFGSGSDLVSQVRTLAIDCAVTSTRLTDPKVDSVRLHQERYVFVGQGELLHETPLHLPSHAQHHTLIDTADDLPLFRYWRDAPGGLDSMGFKQVLKMGTIAAIRQLVLNGAGVSVLPHYFVQAHLTSGSLVEILPNVTPNADHFRLIFRADDPRRSYFQGLAASMKARPLS